jgi:hypothetical protein
MDNKNKKIKKLKLFEGYIETLIITPLIFLKYLNYIYLMTSKNIINNDSSGLRLPLKVLLIIF